MNKDNHKLITIELPPELLVKIKKVAAMQNITLNEAVDKALESFIDKFYLNKE